MASRSILDISVCDMTHLVYRRDPALFVRAHSGLWPEWTFAIQVCSIVLEERRPDEVLQVVVQLVRNTFYCLEVA